MAPSPIQSWLERQDQELVDVIKQDVKHHILEIHNRGLSLSGYSILTASHISEIYCNVAVFNCESNISQEPTSPLARFSVDEWQNYSDKAFAKTNEVIKKRNSYFESLCRAQEPLADSLNDLSEIHVHKLHACMIESLAALRREEVFVGDNIFLVVWIPDSGPDEIVYRSVKRLNSDAVYRKFVAAIGWDDPLEDIDASL